MLYIRFKNGTVETQEIMGKKGKFGEEVSKKEHEKDEAIQEYVKQDPYEEISGEKEEADQKGMGISEKAKKQPSDEDDIAKKKK